MKKLENIILKACGYTVILVLIYYAFMAINHEPSISFPIFAMISAFGVLVSLTTMILGMKKPALPVRILIHYSSLLIAFYVVFIVVGEKAETTSAQLFSAFIVFTVVYALLFISVYLFRKIVKSADKRIDKASAKKQNVNPDKKSEYKPIYK